MNMAVEVGQKIFEVREEDHPDSVSYQFLSTNGPANGTYGFAVSGGGLKREALERTARGFVQ